MKEIVVISGKGGTGKTSLTASFAFIAGANALIADCDVDAANMHLLMHPENIRKEKFFSGELAVIDNDLCNHCGKCMEVCRFDAIDLINDQYSVRESSCEGCGYCSRICEANAIKNIERQAGEWYVSAIKPGSFMVHADLGIGSENSGKLVAKVKTEARELAKRENIGILLIDGPPGLGCPVISSLSGAHYAVIVTEPSISGYHDLQRVYELIKGFNIPAGCIINKSDINIDISGKIHKYLRKNNIHHLSNIPYNENFTKAMTIGKTIMEFSDKKLSGQVFDIWQNILTKINE